MKDKKILVTGAGGFIGRALVNYLRERKYEVLAPGSNVCDVRDREALSRLAWRETGYVIHLAGRTFVPDSWEEPAGFMETNTFGTLNVLELCRLHRVPLTYISAYVYGIPERNPIRETDRICPNNPYAKSKYMAEELCEFYAEQFKVKVNIIRPFNVYGIGQRENFLIPQIIRHAMYEERIHVMDLNPKRDYIYLDDLLDAVVKTMEAGRDYGVYNIGSGKSWSVKEVIDMVQGILGSNKLVACEQVYRRNELNNVVADISRSREELGWEPVHSLEEGLRAMIEYEERCHGQKKG